MANKLEAFALVVISTIIIYSSSYQASDLPISDAVEYAVTAAQLADGQAYQLHINSNPYPARYWPFFSAIVLSPVYQLLGSDELGEGIRAIQFFSILALVFAYLIGRQIYAESAAFGSMLMLLALPGFRYFSRQIMSEVPCVALVLGLYLCYSTRRFLAAGLIIALLTSFRPSYFIYLLPFLVLSYKQRRFSSLVKCSLPSLVIIALGLYYNLKTFGSASFSGYQYWVPEYYSDLSKTFNLVYFKPNFKILLLNSEVINFLFMVALLIYANRNYKEQFAKLKNPISFVFWSGIPMCAFFLLYFFPSSHFYLTLEAMLAVIAGASMRFLDKRAIKNVVWGLLCIALIVRVFDNSKQPERRINADNVAEKVADNSLIISGLDPVYLGYFLRNKKNIEILPSSRSVEYASKAIKINAQALPNSQWISTALENPSLVDKALKQDLKVYIDTSHLSASEIKQFSDLFELEAVAPKLNKVLKLKTRSD